MYGPLFYFAGIIVAGVLGGLFLFSAPEDEAFQPLSETEWASLERSAPPPPTVVAPVLSTLRIDSEPGDALVYVDSIFGGLTPHRADEIVAGWHTITVRKEGFAPRDTMIYLKAGQAASLALALVADTPEPPAADAEPLPTAVAPAQPMAAPATGALRITSSPTGAVVQIDGRSAGVAPRVLRDLTPGTRTVTLSLQGHAAQTHQIVVAPGERTTLRAELVPLTGTLSMIVRPWGSLYVDGVLKASDSDLRHTLTVPIGSHVVRAVHPVLGAQEWRVEVEADRTTTAEFDLQ